MVGFLALRPEDGARLPADRVRLLGLVRHELAIAFRSALLREELAGEQALLAAILDSTTEGILAVDERRRVVRVNRAAVQLLGGRVPPAGASCETVLRCASPEGLRCGDRCRFEEALAIREVPVEAELRMALEDGTEISIAASFSAMAGHEKGAVVVLRDLRAERAAEELRASFMAAVSHELRTPLALISGHVDSLLGLGLDPAAERRSVERIGLAAARLQALVDKLLDLTQAEHASLALHRARVGVAALPGLGDRRPRRMAGDAPFQVSVPAAVPDVYVDALSIGHVLVNLVDNARRYGGTGSIGIRARRRRGTVVITVEDEGPGIPPDERVLVFDRLYRGRAARDAHPGRHRDGPPRLPPPGRGAWRAHLDRAGSRPQRDRPSASRSRATPTISVPEAR